MSILRIVVDLAFVLLSGSVLSQNYPGRPIKLIVPNPPGGVPDIVARLVGAKLSPSLGQPLVVENRVGSNGNIAGELVAHAQPDGYTLLFGQDSLITVNPHLYANMHFDPLKDLAAIATLSSNRFVLAINPALPVRNLQEFIEYARKARPPLAYASGGNGSQHHLTMEMLRARTGIDMLHVPYKGGTPAATATAAGETAAGFFGISVAPLLGSGRLRAIAVAGNSRSALLPDVPSVAESYPGFDATAWQALFAPSGTPEAILSRLRSEVNKVLLQPDVKEKFKEAGGLETFVTSYADLVDLIHSEHAKYGKLVKSLGIEVQ